MGQYHNPKIVTNGLIYHLDPTNGGKGGSKILAKPTQISDCVLWLDADDAETVVTSGANITNWLDKSGKGNHAEDQDPGPTEYPQYDSSRINGRKVVNFVHPDVLKGRLAPTSINSSTLAANTAYGMTSTSGASSTGITASSDGATMDAVNTTDSLVFVEGKKYRASFNATISSGTVPTFAIVDQIAWTVTKTGFGTLAASTGLNTRQWTCTQSGTFVGLWYLNSAAGAFVISDFEIVEVDDAPFSGSGGTVFTVFKQNSFVGSEFAAILELAQGAYASGSYGNRMITSLQGAAFSADKILQRYNGADVWWPIRIENGPPVIACYTNDSTNTINYGNGQVTGTVGYYAEDLGDDSRIYYCLGDDMTSGDHFNGYICEIIIYNKVLTDAERQSVEYYLSRKWAIPLKGRVTTNLADGVNTTISDSGPAEVTHSNTLYFPNPDDDNCDLRLEANEIKITDNLPWTIEFWLKRHARPGAEAAIWGNQLITSEYERMQFTDSLTEDKLIFVDAANGNSTTAITNSVDLDCLHKWRHVVFAFDGTTDPTTAGCVRQYVDGSDKGPAIAFVNANSQITIKRIGSHGQDSLAFRVEGEIGNFRVYNKQLSHAEVLQNYNAQRAKYENKKMSFARPDDLYLYYDAQSGTSSNYYANGTWYDISGGTARNGTLAGDPTFTNEGVKYYAFDGTDDQFNFTQVTLGNAPFTLLFWTRYASGTDYLCSNKDGGPVSFAAGFNGTNLRFRGYGTRAANGDAVSATWHYNQSSGLTASAGTWYQVAFVQDYHPDYGTEATRVRIQQYLDDQVSTADPIYSHTTNGAPVNAIGAYHTNEYNGDVAVAMIYPDVALTHDEIKQNYNYFKHRFGK